MLQPQGNRTILPGPAGYARLCRAAHLRGTRHGEAVPGSQEYRVPSYSGNETAYLVAKLISALGECLPF